MIIEVNDNPSIDSDVVDKFLGDRLYELIMGGLLRSPQQADLGPCTTVRGRAEGPAKAGPAGTRQREHSIRR